MDEERLRAERERRLFAEMHPGNAPEMSAGSEAHPYGGYRVGEVPAGEYRDDTKSILGMTFGILSFLLFWSGPVALVLSVAALVLSTSAKKHGQKRSRWLTGIITGGIGLALSFIFTLVFILIIPDLVRGFAAFWSI